MLKNFKLVVLFVAVLGMASCSDDDGGSGNGGGGGANNGDPVGTWEPTALTYNGTNTITQGGQTITYSYDAVATDYGNATVIFNNDGTYDSSGDGITVDMTTKYMGQEITQSMQAPSFISDGTWAINGNTMTLTNSGSTTSEDYDIVELTNTTMRLKGQIVTTVSGMDVTMNIDMTMTKL
jgi:hypothetical protein